MKLICGAELQRAARRLREVVLRLLADQVVELGYIDSISYETVRRVLKKTKPSPGGERDG